jgi:hypothetical protein
MKLPNGSIDRIVSIFASVNLKDPRRVVRLENTIRKLAADPQSSLPQAMGSEAELEGAYRLLNNRHVAAEVLNDAHAVATARRAKSAKKVLAIHDTTHVECRHADATEVGYLNTGKPGFLFHYTLVVAMGSREPLGIVNAEALFRERPPRQRKAGRRRRKLSGDETAKNKIRESLKWWRGFERAAHCLEGAEVIHVTDREGDSYDLFGRCQKQSRRFIIRIRGLDRRARLDNGVEGALPSIMKSVDGVLCKEVPLSARKSNKGPSTSKTYPPRAARIARLQFSAAQVQINRPRYVDRSLPEKLVLNIVRVNEIDPPDGEPPVEWLLFTSEPIATAADVEAIVDGYRTRWLIEECNKALKTGCRYEQRQFESRHALLTLLAMMLPIACELLWLRRQAREQPTRPASDVLAPLQIQILTVLGPRKLGPDPTVRDALWAVAALGGHLKSNGEPGWQVLQRGMIKLASYEEGWRAARYHPPTEADL